MQTIAKITLADYADLLAAVDAGMTQRQLADRYDCAPSLVARHVARAKRARAPSERTREPDLGLTAEPHNGSMARDPASSYPRSADIGPRPCLAHERACPPERREKARIRPVPLRPSTRHAHTRTRSRFRSRTQLPAPATRGRRHQDRRRRPDESASMGAHCLRT